MKTKILGILLVGLLAIPIAARADEATKNARKEKAKEYMAGQKAENEAFRKTLKDMPEAQREAAIIEHRNQQFAENQANHAKMHEEQMSKLQTKLAANKNLTDAQKQELTAKEEKEYQDNVAQANARHTATLNYAQQVHNDPNLTPEQKREKMKGYYANNKAEHKEHMQGQKEKRQNLREQYKKRKQTEPATQ